MAKSAYYDSCVFLNSLNMTHKEYKSCSHIVDAANIQWLVYFCSELISSETTASELLVAFEISCASAGAVCFDVSAEDGKKQSKKRLPLKRALAKLQLKSRDFLHLMCAVHAGAESLITVDPDFWDASNKATPKSSVKKVATKNVIEKSLPIKICMPSEFLASHAP